MKEFENQNITLKDLFEREQEFSEYCMETRNKNCFKGFVELPEGLKGIVKTRQFILENFKEHDILMVDDDIEKVCFNFEHPKHKDISDKKIIAEIINQTYELARLTNSKLFGWSKETNPVCYSGSIPLSFNNVITAHCCGFLKNHGLWYNTEMNEAEDYWIFLLNGYKNRYCLRDNRYTFISTDPFKNKGGMQSIRNSVDGVRNNEILKIYFGDCVKVKGTTQVKKNIRSYERSVSIPY